VAAQPMASQEVLSSIDLVILNFMENSSTNYVHISIENGNTKKTPPLTLHQGTYLVDWKRNLKHFLLRTAC
jgi:hypothetical protein